MSSICETCCKNHEEGYGSGRFCTAKCARAFSTRKNRIAINRKVSDSLKGRKIGFALNPDSGPKVPRITAVCSGCGKDFKILPSNPRKYCENSCWRSHSGGFRERSGYGKCGWWNGIHFQSTWELAFYLWCTSLGCKCERNRKGYPYTWEGKRHFYYPDFIVEGELVEIKGFLKPVDQAKFSCVGVKVLSEENLQEAFKFIQNTYNCQVEDLWKNLAHSTTLVRSSAFQAGEMGSSPVCATKLCREREIQQEDSCSHPAPRSGKH